MWRKIDPTTTHNSVCCLATQQQTKHAMFAVQPPVKVVLLDKKKVGFYPCEVKAECFCHLCNML